MENDVVKNRPNMRRVSIDATNEVSLSTGIRTPGEITCSSEREFAGQTAAWPGSRLVSVWNQLPRVNRVNKFTNRATAVRRSAIQANVSAAATPNTHIETPGATDTKTARIIGLLREPSGATLRALMDFTGWQSHSVRGFLSRQLSKKRGLRVKSFTRNGERVYKIRN